MPWETCLILRSMHNDCLEGAFITVKVIILSSMKTCIWLVICSGVMNKLFIDWNKLLVSSSYTRQYSLEHLVFIFKHVSTYCVLGCCWTMHEACHYSPWVNAFILQVFMLDRMITLTGVFQALEVWGGDSLHRPFRLNISNPKIWNPEYFQGCLDSRCLTIAKTIGHRIEREWNGAVCFAL